MATISVQLDTANRSCRPKSSYTDAGNIVKVFYTNDEILVNLQ